MKKFLNNPFVKSFILSSLTLYIGGVCSAIGGWDFAQDVNITKKIVLLVVGVIFYVIFLAYYSVYEFNANKIVRLYKMQNEAFEDLMSGIMSSCRYSANGANEVIHSIVNSSKADLKIWNFDKSCQWICDNVYALLCKIGDGREFEVVYDRLVEGHKPEEFVYTNAFANKDKHRPSIYGIKRKISEDDYHDIELFKNNQADMEVVIGTDEIDKIFGHRSKEKRNRNKSKYSQYIAIPIFCNDEKMIGLFEIICMNKTKLGSSKEEIQEIVSKYFVPYSFLLLVLHKLEKALIAKPSESGT